MTKADAERSEDESALHNPHDKLFFSSLRNYKAARDEIRSCLSPEILQRLDIDIYNQIKKSLKMEDTIMTIAQQLRNEGIQEGMQKTARLVALKLMKLGKSLESIAELTELSLEDLHQLKEQASH